jgi:hypothetical protein
MIKDKQIIVGIDPKEIDDPVFFATKVPLKRKVLVIK